MSDWPVPEWGVKSANPSLPYISVSQDDILDDQDSTGQETSCQESNFLLPVLDKDVDISSTAPLLESGINTPTTEFDHGLLELCEARFTCPRSISECVNPDLMMNDTPDETPHGQVEIEVNSPAEKETTYCFATWNWPIIRIIVSYLSMGSIASICVASVALIATLSPDCHNEKNWWQGSVFMESREMRQNDYNKVADLGAVAFIMNDMFEVDNENYVERFDENDVIEIIARGGAKNLSFIGEVFIVDYNHTNIVKLFNRVDQLRLQGLLLRGMNVSERDVTEMKVEWNKIAHKEFMRQKILIVTADFARVFKPEVVQKFDLVYTPLDLEDKMTLNTQVNEDHSSEGVDSPWIQWVRSSDEESSVYMKAVQFLQIILPGSPLLMYDSVLMDDCTETGYYTNLKTMMHLRRSSMAVNSNRALIIGDYGTLLEKNTNIRVLDSLVLVERFYPRAKRYVYIGNFGNSSVRSDSVYKYYFGGHIAASTTGRKGNVDFKDFQIDTGEAVVVEMSM